MNNDKTFMSDTQFRMIIGKLNGLSNDLTIIYNRLEEIENKLESLSSTPESENNDESYEDYPETNFEDELGHKIPVIKEDIGDKNSYLERLRMISKDNSGHPLEIAPNTQPDSPTIEDFDFSVRTYNCLKRSAIVNIDQLVELVKRDDGDSLMRVRNLGRKGMLEIRDKLKEAKLLPPDFQYRYEIEHNYDR